MARDRLGAEGWARRIDEWRRSGLSLPKFCQRHGIKATTMSGWVYKPALKRAVEMARRIEEGRREGAAPSRPSPAPLPAPAFVPVRLREIVSRPDDHGPGRRPAIEVIVGAGRRVVVRRGFDPETLRQVVAALEAGPC